MSAAKLLLFLQDGELRAEAVAVLKKGAATIAFEEHDSDWNSLLDRVAKAHPEVLLLESLAVPGELAIGIRQLRHYSPRLKIVVLHSEADSDHILSAMRAGANEFLHPPLGESLIPALERLFSTGDHTDAVPTRGKIIGFLSAKGGCGATTLACHVWAGELSHEDPQRLLDP